MLSGLPASGKSTYAKELVGSGKWIRVNRDLLRTMLHNDVWSHKNEEWTIDIEADIAHNCLNAGINVVVDDTNLTSKHLSRWRDVANMHKAVFETRYFDTPIDVCIERDVLREHPVGWHVIKNMALQYNFPETPQENIVICDIDGTIADCTHRQHHVQGENKRWDKFFEGMEEDSLRESTKKLLDDYHEKGRPIIFVSARPEKYRLHTQRWLAKHGLGTIYWTLIMRPDNDSREDSLIKGEIYSRYFKGKGIETVIDDRPRVIRMWPSLGIPVIDVGKGIEF